MVEGHRHVEERHAFGDRELQLTDLEGREVHVVDQVVEAPQIAQGGFLDHTSRNEFREWEHRDERANRMTVAHGAVGGE